MVVFLSSCCFEDVEGLGKRKWSGKQVGILEILSVVVEREIPGLDGADD